jgi:Transposase DDE domain group 1
MGKPRKLIVSCGWNNSGIALSFDQRGIAGSQFSPQCCPTRVVLVTKIWALARVSELGGPDFPEAANGRTLHPRRSRRTEIEPDTVRTALEKRAVTPSRKIKTGKAVRYRFSEGDVLFLLVLAEFPFPLFKEDKDPLAQVLAHDSLLCRRRQVVAKAEQIPGKENPHYVVTSPPVAAWPTQQLYEQLYCARGEMENRIKEQLSLFSDRMSTESLRSNQLRLYFSSLAYVLVEALRRVGLAATECAEYQVETIRLRLLKIAAQVRITARKIWIRYTKAYPWKNAFVRPGQLCAAERRNSQQKPRHSQDRGAVRLKLPEKTEPRCLLCGKANTVALNEEK